MANSTNACTSSSPAIIRLICAATKLQTVTWGKSALINSGGPSGANDFFEAVWTAVINKRAGGAGLISGRKAFQRPMHEGVALLHAIQDVYLDPNITVA